MFIFVTFGNWKEMEKKERGNTYEGFLQKSWGKTLRQLWASVLTNKTNQAPRKWGGE